MDHATPKDCFLQSLERCSAQENFIPAFYDRFFSSSDEVRKKFNHTDFEQQNKMLLRSLQLAAGATIGKPESLRELKQRAETHDRYHLNIKPELYSHWLEAIITTAEQFDSQWNDTVESAWRKILGHVIEYMTRKY